MEKFCRENPDVDVLEDEEGEITLDLCYRPYGVEGASIPLHMSLGRLNAYCQERARGKVFHCHVYS